MGVSAVLLLLRAYPSIRPDSLPSIGINSLPDDAATAIVFGSLSLVLVYLFVIFFWSALSDYANWRGGGRVRESWERSVGWPWRLNIFAGQIGAKEAFVGDLPRHAEAIRVMAKSLGTTPARVWIRYLIFLARGSGRFVFSSSVTFLVIDFLPPVALGGVAIWVSWQDAMTTLDEVWAAI